MDWWRVKVETTVSSCFFPYAGGREEGEKKKNFIFWVWSFLTGCPGLLLTNYGNNPGPILQTAPKSAFQIWFSLVGLVLMSQDRVLSTHTVEH